MKPTMHHILIGISLSFLACSIVFGAVALYAINEGEKQLMDIRNYQPDVVRVITPHVEIHHVDEVPKPETRATSTCQASNEVATERFTSAPQADPYFEDPSIESEPNLLDTESE